MKKGRIKNDKDIHASTGNYILGIGKVSQFVAESSNGSKVSFNGYHSQCV